MANNKVQLSDGTVLLDLTGDTVTPENLLSGATAHNAAGEAISGTYVPKTMTVVGTTLKLAPATVSGNTVIV